jgi:hypothetical protein
MVFGLSVTEQPNTALEPTADGALSLASEFIGWPRFRFGGGSALDR